MSSSGKPSSREWWIKASRSCSGAARSWSRASRPCRAGEILASEKMGKIVRDKYPELDEADQEAVRQHAIAAMNFTQQAKKTLLGDGTDAPSNMAPSEGFFVEPR